MAPRSHKLLGLLFHHQRARPFPRKEYGYPFSSLRESNGATPDLKPSCSCTLPTFSIPFAYRSLLFLSSPSSSLVSQAATPLFFPADVDLAVATASHASLLVDREESEKKLSTRHAFCVHQQQDRRDDLEVESSVDSHGRPQNGRSSREVFNWPNAISFGRLLSGPALAWLILEGLPQPAFIGLVFAGASDWLDGYIARRENRDSVVGTYLDPLADKVLIGCVTLAMAHVGYLPPALVVLVVARDVALVGGSLVHRAYSLNGEWKSLKRFFDIAEGKTQKIKPIFISKVNTVLQLALVGTALGQPAFQIEDGYLLVPMLSWAVAFTTCLSWASYGLKVWPKYAPKSKA